MSEAPSIEAAPGKVGSETWGVASDSDSDDDSFRCRCGVRVADTGGLPDEFEVIAIPGRTYAVFVHSGPMSELPSTCHAIWHEWLPG